MAKKPTPKEIREYLNIHNPLGLKNATMTIINERNHLIYRLEKHNRFYALRMINPESYRRHEWITMREEYEILKALAPTGLAPAAYYLAEDFSPPFLIQEFVEATCFNDLKPLSKMHLKAVARAIAILNSQDITPERLPFLEKYREESYEKRGFVWHFRLLDSIRRSFRKDVIIWAFKIMPLLWKTRRVLKRFESEFPHADWGFHFDGAHCGNTYWRDGKVVFLDWQKVSWRNDPTFTLVRFATSASEKGVVEGEVFNTLIRAYREIRPIHNFAVMADKRLLERQVSDLVWVLWEHTRRNDPRPVEVGTSAVTRYEWVVKRLSL